MGVGPLGEAFHSQRLTIQSSQVGYIAAAQRGRWDHRRRMATVMALLDDPALDALISGESLFADLPRVLADLSASPNGVLCHRTIYPGAAANRRLPKSVSLIASALSLTGKRSAPA